MAINGSLDEASLTDVLQLLSLGRKTGRLSVSDQSNLGHIFLEAGKITHAFLATRRDRLGDILFKSGHITQDQLTEGLRLQEANPEKKFGEILVETGATSSAALKHHIQIQIEEAVYFLFTWRRGDFAFERDARPANQDFEISIDPESLLLEGARRVDEWSVIEKKIPSFEMVFRADRARIEASDAKLSEEQKRIVKLLDGARNLAAIVEDTGMIQFEVGKALYGLITAGFAEPVGPGQLDSDSGDASDDAAGHLDNNKLLAYLAHQGEFADSERRRQSRLHIADCPTCSKRLQEIHVRRSQGLPAIPNEVGVTALEEGSASQPNSRRSGSDRRRSDASAFFDPKADRRVHGAGDRRSSARAAAVQGSAPTERRRRGDRRNKERRRGDRRRSEAVDRSDRNAVERRRGLDRRLRERRVEMRRFADVRMRAKGGSRQAVSIGNGTGPAITQRVTMAGSAHSGASNNGQDPSTMRRPGAKRSATTDSSLRPTNAGTLAGAAQGSLRSPADAGETNRQGSSGTPDTETTAQASVRKPENADSSVTAEQGAATHTETSSEITHRQEPDSKAPDSVPAQPSKRPTRPSVRRGRESPLRGIPLLADGTEWVFVDRSDPEDEEENAGSGTVDLDSQVPKPVAKAKEAETTDPSSQAGATEVNAVAPEPKAAHTEAETTAVMPVAAAPKPADDLPKQQAGVTTPAVAQENQEVERARRELAIAKSDANKAKQEAKKAKADAEEATRVADQAKKAADQAKSEAERAATKAESERSAAAKRKTEARQTTLEAEKATTLAERKKEEAERARLEAENEKRVAEQERKKAEKTKKEAEKAKSAAEKAAAKARKSKSVDRAPESIEETVAAAPGASVAAPVAVGVADAHQGVDLSAPPDGGRKRPVLWIGVAALAVVATGLGWLARPLFETGLGSEAVSAAIPGQATAGDQPSLDEVPVVVSDTLREDSLPGERMADSLESVSEGLVAGAPETPVRVEGPPIAETPSVDSNVPRQREVSTDSVPVQIAPTPAPVQPEVEEPQTRREPVAEAPPTPTVVEEQVDSGATPEVAPTAIAFSGSVREIGTNVPLAGVLVSISETDLVTTTDAAGAFSFDSISAGSLTVTAELEGYMPGRETIVAQLGENVELGIVVHRPPNALEPDEEVDTGPWAVTDRAGAEAVLGRPVAVISDLWLESLARPATGNRPRVRVSHLSDSGERITLIVTRSGPPNPTASPRVTALRIIAPTEAYPITTGTASFGGLLVTAKAILPADSLRGMLQRLVEARGG